MCLAAIAGAARAQEPSPTAPGAKPAEPASPPAAEKGNAWETAAATYRSGFTASIFLGFGGGSASGYPNDFGKIDVPAFRAATSGVGSDIGVYLGGALTDWFTFAMGLDFSSFRGTNLVSSSTVFAFHLEAFPFFARGGACRDAGLFADFGTGVATIKQRSNNLTFADAGAPSVAGLGAFVEPWRAGDHLALGPYVSWHYQWSDSMSRYVAAIGIRGVFYGGAVAHPTSAGALSLRASSENRF
jgi:hypothetical protein